MAFFEKKARVVARFFPSLGKDGASGMHAQPECVVLRVRDGVTPGTKPPVRLFVGTEPEQYRAERVFIWSIEQVRDPARVYEIYLMKELAGFDRRGWLTGFTNYRFAIPHFAYGTGRAIYNDADQIYLADPGELFDTDLGSHGFLALSDRDTSVMVLDCARMASVWTLAAAQSERRKDMEAKARAVAGLYGPLDAAWHARDQEYVPGYSKLVHYTAIHMQPWHPFPQRYAYQRNPVGQVWRDLERAADAAGYHVFTAAHPSAQYRMLHTPCRMAYRYNGSSKQLAQPPSREDLGVLHDLSTAAEARTLLDYGLGTETSGWLSEGHDDISGLTVTRYAAARSASAPPSTRFDGVVCMQGLEDIPAEDVPWVLAEMFGYATRFVYIVLTQGTRSRVLPDGTHIARQYRPLAWWEQHLAAASVRHPQVHWKLGFRSCTALGRNTRRMREGGRCLQGTPIVWVLADGHPGNTAQSLGLVEALGWPCDVKELRFTSLVSLHNTLFGAFGATRLGLHQTRSAPLAPPWPDVVFTGGWRSAHVARWIRKQSQGRTRLVQLGRRGSQIAALFDAAVSCTYYRFAPHMRRIETVAPLHHVTPVLLDQAAQQWRDMFKDAPKPHIALLVGGTSSVYHLDAATARRLGEDVRAYAEAMGGTVFATTSRRTGPKATEALRLGLGPSSSVHRWQVGQPDNPYLGYLALADVLVVTGDSESMLAEAASSGRPVYIYPLPKRYRVIERLKEWVVRCAQSPHWNRRGTRKPQQGIAYLCARLIERGIVLPPNDLDSLHQSLTRLGIARFFGEPSSTGTPSALQEMEKVASQVRALLGIRESQHASQRAMDASHD